MTRIGPYEFGGPGRPPLCPTLRATSASAQHDKFSTSPAVGIIVESHYITVRASLQFLEEMMKTSG
jgi:hypothetical protein